MNIIFFSQYYFPHIGGVEKHAREVAEGLIKKGHKVTIFTLKHDIKLTDIEIWHGVTIIRLPHSNNKFSIWKNLLQKKDLIKKADIVHCHDVFFWYLPFKILFPTKKVYITFHGWEGVFPIPQKNILIRRISAQLSKGNICVGDYIKKHYHTKTNFITYGGTNYQGNKTIPNRINKTSKIIFIGRLEKDLGMEDYLKALKTLKEKHNFKITFIGDGTYRKQAETLGNVTGFVKDIKPYINTNSLIFASSYLTILESMAAGKLVFSLYQNKIKEDYLKKFPGVKYIKVAGSVEELVNQVKNHLQGSTLKVRKQFHEAQVFASQQTWDKVINMYLEIWNQK